MINFLIEDVFPQSTDSTSFGGLPPKSAGSTVAWPTCTHCKSEMQYLGKIKTDIGLELIFMCDIDPGLCDQWVPGGGGNCVLVVPAGSTELMQPADKEQSLRKTEYGAKILTLEVPEYDAAREVWTGNRREVLGQLWGEPEWLQADETPICDCCNQPMRFVAQLEEGPNHETAMNFGMGVAFLFDCPAGKTGKFLWQC